jgi:hypothetical protein
MASRNSSLTSVIGVADSISSNSFLYNSLAMASIWSNSAYVIELSFSDFPKILLAPGFRNFVVRLVFR